MNAEIGLVGCECGAVKKALHPGTTAGFKVKIPSPSDRKSAVIAIELLLGFCLVRGAISRSLSLLMDLFFLVGIFLDYNRFFGFGTLGGNFVDLCC